MRIHMTARHCEFEPEDRLLVEQRLEKMGRFARDIQEAHVILTHEKYRYIGEITLRLKGHEATSREEANVARTAIELAADRLEHQIRKLKGRRLERRRADRTPVGDGASTGLDGEESKPPGERASEE